MWSKTCRTGADVCSSHTVRMRRVYLCLTLWSLWSVRRCGGGAGHQRGVQDLEEEHALPVRPGDDACAGVAQPDGAVAPGCQQVKEGCSGVCEAAALLASYGDGSTRRSPQAGGKGLRGPQASFRDTHVRRAEPPRYRECPGSKRRRPVWRVALRQRERR